MPVVELQSLLSLSGTSYRGYDVTYQLESEDSELFGGITVLLFEEIWNLCVNRSMGLGICYTHFRDRGDGH